MVYYPKITQETYRRTIDNIENICMKNCQPEYVKDWLKTRKEMFDGLIELQLKEFDIT